MISREQGVRPKHAHVVLGYGSQVTVSLRDRLYCWHRARADSISWFQAISAPRPRAMPSPETPASIPRGERGVGRDSKPPTCCRPQRRAGKEAPRRGITTIETLGDLDPGASATRMQAAFAHSASSDGEASYGRESRRTSTSRDITTYLLAVASVAQADHGFFIPPVRINC
jgi:hypothetical protein